MSLTVAALILAGQLGSPLAQDTPSVEQLGEIADLLSSNDLVALRSYIETNPELLVGDSRLAVLLRRFKEETDGLPVYLGYEGGASDTLSELQDLAPEAGGDEDPGPGDDAVDLDDAPGPGDAIY